MFALGEVCICLRTKFKFLRIEFSEEENTWRAKTVGYSNCASQVRLLYSMHPLAFFVCFSGMLS